MKLVQASIAENGTINGLAGDQNTREVNISKFYGKWDFIIRFKDKELADNLATIAIAIANNNYIGYGQFKRNTLWKYAKKYCCIRDIKTKCCCDCSSLVSVGVNLAYYAKYKKWLPNYNIDVNACTTANMIGKLTRTDMFEVMPFNKNNLKRGDIVLRVGKHTAIIIEE